MCKNTRFYCNNIYSRLNNTRFPYELIFANLGLDIALSSTRALERGISVCNKEITCHGVTKTYNIIYLKIEESWGR